MTPCTTIGCNCETFTKPEPRREAFQDNANLKARHETAVQDLVRQLRKDEKTRPSLTAHDTLTLRAVAEDPSLSEFVRLEVYKILVSNLAPATGVQVGIGMVR